MIFCAIEGIAIASFLAFWSCVPHLLTRVRSYFRKPAAQ